MPRAPCAFRKNDVVRSLKAVQQAGFPASRVEFEYGENGKCTKYTVILDKVGERPLQSSEPNEWDVVYGHN